MSAEMRAKYYVDSLRGIAERHISIIESGVSIPLQTQQIDNLLQTLKELSEQFKTEFHDDDTNNCITEQDAEKNQ